MKYVGVSPKNRRVVSTCEATVPPSDTPEVFFIQMEHSPGEVNNKTFLNMENKLEQAAVDLWNYTYINGDFVLDCEMTSDWLRRKVLRKAAELQAAPLHVQGHLLDCDEAAVRNLLVKKIEVEQGNVTGFVWRMADNSVATWQTAAEYLAFITAALAAASQRGTAVYLAKWQHEDNLSVANAAQLQAYDINTGWPT
jgi:hypothetical protein